MGGTEREEREGEDRGRGGQGWNRKKEVTGGNRLTE